MIRLTKIVFMQKVNPALCGFSECVGRECVEGCWEGVCGGVLGVCGGVLGGSVWRRTLGAVWDTC